MLRWSSNKSFLRLKIGRQKRSNAEHKFTNASWSTSVVVECSQASYVYLMGGCNFEKWSVSKRNVQVNTSSGFVVKMKDLPKPKFAHSACLVGQEIVIIGGISDMMHNMGMRSVPVGDTDCFAFDFLESKWRTLPDVPVGRLHSTLIVINNRFIFQIGGFEDFDFDIYKFDMQHCNRSWKRLSLDLTKPIVDLDVHLSTR